VITEWVAPRQSPKPEPDPFRGAVHPNSLRHVIGAGGLKAAAACK
jgi:hypothetical protein